MQLPFLQRFEGRREIKFSIVSAVEGIAQDGKTKLPLQCCGAVVEFNEDEVAVAIAVVWLAGTDFQESLLNQLSYGGIGNAVY